MKRESKRPVQLWFEADQAKTLKKLATKQGKTDRELIETLIGPMLTAENSLELTWYLVGLNQEDADKLEGYCNALNYQADEVLDVLIGDAIEEL